MHFYLSLLLSTSLYIAVVALPVDEQQPLSGRPTSSKNAFTSLLDITIEEIRNLYEDGLLTSVQLVEVINQPLIFDKWSNRN
jgi:hypothetical protein